MENKLSESLETATLAGGCFWCTEAVYLNLKGVKTVVSGYMGGHTLNPTYRDICTGTTGHAEVIQITFDLNQISFSEILEVFLATHDPTTLNQQGADKGTQYRSAIFYHSELQKSIAETSILAAQESKLWDDPIVTEVSPTSTFYKADEYHQNYYEKNPYQGYCIAVVAPKVEKFKKLFAEKQLRR